VGRRGETAHRVGVAVQLLDPGQGVRHRRRVEVVADRGTLLLGRTNVKTTKKWYVKPDVEDLREAATTWDGLHGEAEGRA
jgi:hypothetical protein